MAAFSREERVRSQRRTWWRCLSGWGLRSKKKPRERGHTGLSSAPGSLWVDPTSTDQLKKARARLKPGGAGQKALGCGWRIVTVQLRGKNVLLHHNGNKATMKRPAFKALIAANKRLSRNLS
jgi:hypothetical protein